MLRKNLQSTLIAVSMIATLLVMPVPVGAAPNTLEIHNGPLHASVAVMSNGVETAAEFYDYDDEDRSSKMGFERSDESRLFVWADPDGTTSLFINHDRENSRDGGTAHLGLDGLGADGYWSVKDDDALTDVYSRTEIFNEWNGCCTDGGVYSDIGDTFCITVTPLDWGFNAGGIIDTWSFLTGDSVAPTRYTLDMTLPVVIEGNGGCTGGDIGHAASLIAVLPEAGEILAPGDTGVISSPAPLYEERHFAKASHPLGTITETHGIVDIGMHVVTQAGHYAVPGSNGGKQVYSGSETEEVILEIPGLGTLEVRGIYADAFASCSYQAGITRVREVLLDGVRVFLPVNAGIVTGHNTIMQLGQYTLHLNNEIKSGTGFTSTAFRIVGGQNGLDVRLGYAHSEVVGCAGEAPEDPSYARIHWGDPLAPIHIGTPPL